MHNYLLEIDQSNATVSDLAYEFSERSIYRKQKHWNSLPKDDGIRINWDNGNVVRHHLKNAVAPLRNTEYQNQNRRGTEGSLFGL